MYGSRNEKKIKRLMIFFSVKYVSANNDKMNTDFIPGVRYELGCWVLGDQLSTCCPGYCIGDCVLILCEICSYALLSLNYIYC